MFENDLHIIPFSEELAAHFKELNLAWLRKYFYVEPIDEEMLSQPQKYIIDKGGHIFFALLNNEVVGTFALIKHYEDTYELSKMAVDEQYQGYKIGNKLMRFAIEKGKELKARKLILFSNTILTPAIHLYRKYGFVEVPLGNSEYKRSNIKMELALTPGPSPEGEGRNGDWGTEEDGVTDNELNEPSPILYGYGKEMRQHPTSAEQLLWDNLRNRNISGLKFRRQHPIGQYIADFYCHEKLLVVEVDGGIHNTPENKDYDRARDEYLKSEGITVLRFTNDEVLHHMSATLQKIREAAKEIKTINTQKNIEP